MLPSYHNDIKLLTLKKQKISHVITTNNINGAKKSKLKTKGKIKKRRTNQQGSPRSYKKVE